METNPEVNSCMSNFKFSVNLENSVLSFNQSIKLVDMQGSGMSAIAEHISRQMKDNLNLYSTSGSSKQLFSSDRKGVVSFLSGYCKSDTDYVKIRDLYCDYSAFCKANNAILISRMMFLQYLEGVLGFKIQRKAVNNETHVYCRKVAAV